MPAGSIVSGGETQDQIDGTMAVYSKLFSGLGIVINVDPVDIEVDLTFPSLQQKCRVILMTIGSNSNNI